MLQQNALYIAAHSGKIEILSSRTVRETKISRETEKKQATADCALYRGLE